MSKFRKCVAVWTFLFSVTGCSWLPETSRKRRRAGRLKRFIPKRTARSSQGNYTRAVKLFDTLEGRFPYGRYAQQAILEGAYANYRQGETTPALASCDRFIRTYPNHPNVDYAYYLKGLINFSDDQGLLGYVVEPDLSSRDPKMTKEAFGAFRELVDAFSGQ